MRKKILLCMILGFSISSFAQQFTEKEIIESFKQGSTNCASISVIKLAIAKYGLNNVFLSVSHENQNYHIVARDGSVIDLSDSELQEMSHLDYFEKGTNDSILQYAKFLYAVMAKHKQRINGLRNIRRAAIHKVFYHLLVMDTATNFEYLGLNGLYRTVPKEEIENHRQIIITSNRHSAFSTLGSYDEYGRILPNREYSGKHGQIKNDNYILVN